MYVRTVALIIGLIAALAALAAPASAGTPLPDQRIDMRVLLLSADGNEPAYQAWRAQLEREGVPFDAIVATQAAPITYAQLADGTARARYQAVVLATGGLVYFDGTSYVSALDASEWDAINELERTFGIRQVTAFVYPSPAYGLNSPTVGSSMAGIVGSLTPAAQPLFGYLKGQVAFDGNAWGYQATPVDPASFRTFVSGPNGSSLVGAYTHPDGREELVVTVDSNPWMIHSQLLRHGMLSWATRGVYLGSARDYLELQIDDVFLPDDRWDMATNTTPEESPRPIRMTALDVLRAATWQASTGMRLDLVYNGFGGESSRDHACEDADRDAGQLPSGRTTPMTTRTSTTSASPSSRARSRATSTSRAARASRSTRPSWSPASTRVSTTRTWPRRSTRPASAGSRPTTRASRRRTESATR